MERSDQVDGMPWVMGTRSQVVSRVVRAVGNGPFDRHPCVLLDALDGRHKLCAISIIRRQVGDIHDQLAALFGADRDFEPVKAL